jgi:predicted nucleic acid-binding protein
VSGLQFDTNALIALPVWVRGGHPVIQRIERGDAAAACALVWYEFVCGPVSEEHKALARAVLAGRIEPVTEAAADIAGRLYNATGRIRRTRTGALIAACAMSAGAELVTLNREDFLPFVEFGLALL